MKNEDNFNVSLTTSIIFFFSYKLCCKLGNLTIVNKYDFQITTYVHVLYYIFYKINNYMYSRFNISTGAFISLKTPSQVAEASYHIRICVCNIWFTDQCHSYKKFTLNPVQFQSSFFVHLCISRTGFARDDRQPCIKGSAYYKRTFEGLFYEANLFRLRHDISCVIRY